MEYDVVIGLEVHVQIKSESKMFCSCATGFGAEPNTHVCPVCMGYPGVLPVPNRFAILQTVRAGLLTECEIARFSKFDRKSYFYPDMPKNYQISQYDLPFCEHGRIRLGGKGFSGNEVPDKYIGITRIHLEEDVAKLTHFHGQSGVDYNRAGTPLMETVSEPEIKSADEAYCYLTRLKEIMRFGGISDCDMEKGQMRCDVNISLRPAGQKEFGVKIELKNLNSFRAVHRAIEYEIWRQGEMLDRGEKLYQETRGWNDDRGESYLMRRKEEAHDYRYFPDPDLMPVVFTDADIEEIKASLPELPEARRSRFVNDFALTAYDAGVLTSSPEMADYFDRAAAAAENKKILANWMIGELLRELGERKMEISDCPIEPERFAKLTALAANRVINGAAGRTVLSELFTSDASPEDIVKEKELAQVSDAGAVMEFVEQAIAANPAQVEQYKAGNPKVLQFLVGQVMKLSKGKADPRMAMSALQEKLQ